MPGACNLFFGECMPVTALKNFLRLESSAGVLLVIATIGALLIVNSPLQ